MSQPIAFHATREPGIVLRDGLIPQRGNDACGGHVCVAEHPYLCHAIFGDRAVTLIVDVSGLPVEWDQGEGRLHGTIPADRLEVMDPQPIVGCWSGWEDPALRFNHSACLARSQNRLAH